MSVGEREAAGQSSILHRADSEAGRDGAAGGQVDSWRNGVDTVCRHRPGEAATRFRTARRNPHGDKESLPCNVLRRLVF